MKESIKEIENLGLDISESLENLCKLNGKCAADLQGFLAKSVSGKSSHFRRQKNPKKTKELCA